MPSIFSGNGLAVSVFNGLAEKIIGRSLPLTADPDNGDDLIIIGSDSDHLFVAEKMLSGKWQLPAYRSGNDDYFIRSYEDHGRTVLLLGGGRPRAFLYAVYAYFEAIGCSYFWDGDIIPQMESLPLKGFDPSAYAAYPIVGSMALTARGIEAVESMELQGLEE